MSYKLDKYVIKSLESIKTYAMGNTDIMVPDIYLQKLTQYGGKIPTSDIVFEVYNIVLESDNEKISSKMLSNVLDVFIMCGPFVPDEPNLKVFVSNLFVDTLFCMIVACCQKKVCSKKVMKLCQIVCEHYLNTCDFDFNFALMQKMSKCTKPMLTILKLLNRKEKSNIYVDFLKSQVVGNENRLLNEQLGGMYQEALLLNEFDEIKMLNDKILKMIGSGVDTPPQIIIPGNELTFGGPSPTSGQSIPTSGQSIPTSGQSTPTSGQSTPTSRQLPPTSGQSTPTPDFSLDGSGKKRETGERLKEKLAKEQEQEKTRLAKKEAEEKLAREEQEQEKAKLEEQEKARLAKKTIRINGIDFVLGASLDANQVSVLLGVPITQTERDQTKQELEIDVGDLNNLSDEEL